MEAKKTDFQLIQKAQNGDKDAMNDVLRRYMPVVRKEAQKRGMGKIPIPPSAILGEGVRLAASAIQSFDNTQGAAFETHLTSQLRGLTRYVNTNKRIDRIPDNKALLVPKYKSLHALLKIDKGREPTHNEMADAMGISPAVAAELGRSLSQKTYAGSGLENISEAEQAANDRLKETIDMSYYTWPAEKQLVFDYLFGKHGKPILEAPEIQKRVGLSQAKFYRIRTQLLEEIR